ncbi:hypothetical protein JYU34_020213 [Plutella xylostella]|uniref:Protein kinase domain-containing protein n=1 Tax=Plutella xylostella TaxID=51655 RepID=A0ABQ7PU30_PLUXY|nr:hypothetical protein JYU34_020213 [Plutella xylostella]
MSAEDKWVRRFSVDETAQHQDGFTIYKITSVLFPRDCPTAMTEVSVWHRYSAVRALHRRLGAISARSGNVARPKLGLFTRFRRQNQVIEARARYIKELLDFVAEHQLLFTSTEFVNFLQSGYPPPAAGGAISEIRSSLQLPPLDPPPLARLDSDSMKESDEETTDGASTSAINNPERPEITSPDINIANIQIFESDDIEIQTPIGAKTSDSFESFSSLESLNSDLFDEVSKVTIDKPKPSVKSKSVLPDLIIFDAPSTSKFDDYHTMTNLKNSSANSDTISLDSSMCDSESKMSLSRVSLYSKKSVLSSSEVQSKTRTEDSYVFEAGYMLNLAARCENIGDYQQAFDCYKSGIEKMLIGVQTDSDPQRRALIKEKTNKYLSYAEAIYRDHLSQNEITLQQSLDPPPRGALPAQRPYEHLALFRFIAVLGSSLMLVLNKEDQTCYVMKVIQKIPNNLTEFDDYFLQRGNETKKPILPTNIPYMVPLYCYVETTNLIFLVLSYAPGEKLFDYIKNYVKSVPNTPARELNLENVFAEPLKQKLEHENKNDNVLVAEITKDKDEIDSVKIKFDEKTNDSEKVNKLEDKKTETKDNLDISVNELVINSQKLLSNVNKVLNDSPKTKKSDDFKENVEIKVVDKEAKIDAKKDRNVDSPLHIQSPALPPAAPRRWAAEILAAVDSLHNAGVILGDLNPNNILLGDGGQAILTYFIGYDGTDVALAILGRQSPVGYPNLYIAPELHLHLGSATPVADYWSLGAVLYYLICSTPLSTYHSSVFTSHTLLHIPEGIDLEAKSILTQLLTYDPLSRLGARGVDEIKRHPYFKSIDWDTLYEDWRAPG